jgi:hypothetical protein
MVNRTSFLETKTRKGVSYGFIIAEAAAKNKREIKVNTQNG